jgi:hypothetical protein
VIARTMLEMVSEGREVLTTLRDGSVLRGQLHDSLTLADARSLVGRCLDLESAYKQLLVKQSSQWASVIMVFNVETSRDELYIAEVLPFGAAASVFAFNRYARAIRNLGTRLFGLVWVNFFDDYPMLDINASGAAAQATAERLLTLLGWRFSCKESKRLDFADTFDALGVVFDLRSACQGWITVRNKPDRVVAIGEAIAQVLAEQECRQAVAASLRGRFQYAEGQVYARAVAINMPHFRQRAMGRDGSCHVTLDLANELRWVVAFLQSSAPRVLKAKDMRAPLLIFTDAALEQCQSVATIGGVMLDGADVEYSAAKLDPHMLSRLQHETRHVIAVLEVLPVACAFKLWAQHTLHRRVFYVY